MSATRPVGLIGSGNVMSSAFAHLPGLTERLGPVKASSLRLASRIANGLRAGHPVRNYKDLDRCRVIVICTPDTVAPAIAAELASSGIAWKGKTVLLADTWLDSGDLRALAWLGAETGSLCHSETPNEKRCLIEGSRLALVEAKRLLQRGGFRIVPVETEAKALIMAALNFSESLIFPLLAAAEECLRYAEVPALEASGLLDRAVTRASRAYGKSRRKGWTGPLADQNEVLLSHQFKSLAQVDRRLAQLLRRYCIEALDYFGSDRSWLPQAGIPLETSE